MFRSSLQRTSRALAGGQRNSLASAVLTDKEINFYREFGYSCLNWCADDETRTFLKCVTFMPILTFPPFLFSFFLMGNQPSRQAVQPVGFDEKRAQAENDSRARRLKYLSEPLANLSLDDDEQQFKARYGPLTAESLKKFSHNFWKDSKNRLALNAVTDNDPTQVLVNRHVALRDQHVFNVKLDLEGAITNQKSSGRCWLFAGTNVLRLAVIQKYKLRDDFELSQSYLFFYGM